MDLQPLNAKAPQYNLYLSDVEQISNFFHLVFYWERDVLQGLEQGIIICWLMNIILKKRNYKPTF